MDFYILVDEINYKRVGDFNKIYVIVVWWVYIVKKVIILVC